MAADALKRGIRAAALMGASVAIMVGLVLLLNAARYGLPGILAGLLLVGAGGGAARWAFRDQSG